MGIFPAFTLRASWSGEAFPVGNKAGKNFLKKFIFILEPSDLA
jgi:hypothetical protein